MGRLFLDFFSSESCHVYVCKCCLSNHPGRTKTVHLASSTDLVSKVCRHLRGSELVWANQKGAKHLYLYIFD